MDNFTHKSKAAGALNYGQGNAVMILVGDKMGLTPALVGEAKRHLQGGVIHVITAKAMEDAAVHINDQLRHDAALIAQANDHANEIKLEYGFSD